MFGRVGACGVAAFIVVSTELFCGHAGVVAGANALGMMNSTPPAQIEAQVPAENSLHDDAAATRTKVAAADPTPPPIKPSAPLEPFGLSTIPWFAGEIFEKWKTVEADIRAEKNILAHCRENMRNCPPEAQEFLAIIAAGHAQTGVARIGVINRAINLKIQKMSDLKQWGVPDHWSAPLETFRTHRGDCEDYAIAKFVALVESGVAPEDVKLVVVRDSAASEGHAVVAVHTDAGWIVLDNRWLALVEDNEMRRMSPLYLIDYTGVRAYVRLPPHYAAAAL